MSNKLYLNIAASLRDFARFERLYEPQRALYNIDGSTTLKPCEGCSILLKGGGLCPTCLEVAAGACERIGRGKV